MSALPAWICGLAALLTTASPSMPQSLPEPIVLCEDAGWCWFQDERVIADGEHRIVFGSVASGHADPELKGSVRVTRWNVADGDCRTSTLH